MATQALPRHPTHPSDIIWPPSVPKSEASVLIARFGHLVPSLSDIIGINTTKTRVMQTAAVLKALLPYRKKSGVSRNWIRRVLDLPAVSVPPKAVSILRGKRARSPQSDGGSSIQSSSIPTSPTSITSTSTTSSSTSSPSTSSPSTPCDPLALLAPHFPTPSIVEAVDSSREDCDSKAAESGGSGDESTSVEHTGHKRVRGLEEAELMNSAVSLPPASSSSSSPVFSLNVDEEQEAFFQQARRYADAIKRKSVRFEQIVAREELLNTKVSVLTEKEKVLERSLKECDMLRSTLIESLTTVSETMKRKWLDDPDIREQIRGELRIEVSAGHADQMKADIEAAEDKCFKTLSVLHAEEISRLKQSHQNELNLLKEQSPLSQQGSVQLNATMAVKVKEAAQQAEARNSLLLAHSGEISRLNQSHQSAIDFLKSQLSTSQQRLTELQSTLAQQEEALILERLKNRLQRPNPSPTPVESSSAAMNQRNVIQEAMTHMRSGVEV